jgi:Cft2 family RNA processing exonuclease
LTDFDLIDVVCNDSKHHHCPIKLSSVYCDGFKSESKIGVFSHFHSDHISAITECIGEYDVLITHPITFEAITAIKPGFKLREQWVTLDGNKYKTNFGTVRLLKANHIPGSSQVHVETDGTSLLYSGDFNYPDIEIQHADHLVLDATHGDPSFDGKTDRKSVMNRMFEDVKEKIFSRKPVIIYSPSGTLQELIRHFEVAYDGSKLSHDVEFVADKKQKDILLKIFKHEKNEFRDIIDYDSYEYWDLISSNKPCVIFLTNGVIVDSSLSNYYKIMIDRFKFTEDKPAIIPFEGGCRYNLASHASIENILNYVGDVNPKTVVTDFSRSGYAPTLAKLIHLKYPEINAYPRPANIKNV